MVPDEPIFILQAAGLETGLVSSNPHFLLLKTRLCTFLAFTLCTNPESFPLVSSGTTLSPDAGSWCSVIQQITSAFLPALCNPTFERQPQPNLITSSGSAC